jgi:hypothetical protein
MSRLQILDLDFCHAVNLEEAKVRGGFTFPDFLDLLKIRDFDVVLDDYKQTEVSSDSESSLFKLEKPGSYGYKLETNDGKSKFSYVMLFGDESNGIQRISSFSKAVSE